MAKHPSCKLEVGLNLVTDDKFSMVPPLMRLPLLLYKQESLKTVNESGSDN